MSGAALDDSVQKLNEFCGLLEQTQADLQTELENYENLAEQFD